MTQALERAGYFARCWPRSGQGQRFEFVRLIEAFGPPMSFPPSHRSNEDKVNAEEVR